MTYSSTYKYVVNSRSGDTFLLYQCGTTAPSLTSLGYANTTKVFAVPLQGVSTGLTPTFSFLELLGVRSKIKYIDPTYVVSPCLQKLIVCTTPILGTWNPVSTTAVAAVDAVLTDPFGTGASNTAKDLVFDASVAPLPLARAEWIKFLSLFFNAESTANAQFAAIQAAYTSVAAAAAGASEAKPVVAWASYYDGRPWGSTEQWVLSAAPYKTQFTTDAGATSPAAITGLTADIYYSDSAAFRAALKVSSGRPALPHWIERDVPPSGGGAPIERPHVVG